MEQLSSTCVICSSNVSPETTESVHIKTEQEPFTIPAAKLLDAQLNVIFILRNIYELEAKHLESYLKTWGNPGNWVRLCETCEEDVSGLRKVYEDLHQISREFERRKGVLLEKSVQAGSKAKEVLLDCRRKFTKRGRKPKVVASSIQVSFKKEATTASQPGCKSEVNPAIVKNVIENVKVEPAIASEEVHIYPEWSIVDELLDLDENELTCEDGGGEPDPPQEDEDDPDFEIDFQPGDISSESDSNSVDDQASDAASEINTSDSEDDSDPDFKINKPKQIRSLKRPNKFTKRGPKPLKKPKVTKTEDPVEENNSEDEDISPRHKQADGRNRRKIRCPFCNSIFRVSPFATFSKHLQVCAETLAGSTPSLVCSLCRGDWSGSSSTDVRDYLEHAISCWDYHKGPPSIVPWIHAVVKCNLCEDSCYLPVPEFTRHVFFNHQHRYGCTQCSFRSSKHNPIATRHWNQDHKNLSDTPIGGRVETLPVPNAPWWCPGFDCLQQFEDEASRNAHLESCPVKKPKRSKRCSICEGEYFSNEELELHRVYVHGCLKETSRSKPKSKPPPSDDPDFEIDFQPGDKSRESYSGSIDDQASDAASDADFEVKKPKVRKNPQSLKRPHTFTKSGTMPTKKPKITETEDPIEENNSDDDEDISPRHKQADGRNRRKIRCPFCYSIFRVSPFVTFSKHLQVCAETLAESTPFVVCSLCRGDWSGPSSTDVRKYLEHAISCWDYHKGPPSIVPWIHSVVKCNLCEDSCYLPFPEFTQHVFFTHQHQYGCTQCSFRSSKHKRIATRHWKLDHKYHLDTPMTDRVETLPDGQTPPLPNAPWWCPGFDCLQQFEDEASRNAHLESCTLTKPKRSKICSICEGEYFSNEELQMHRVYVHGYLKETTKAKSQRRPGRPSNDPQSSNSNESKKCVCSTCGRLYWNQYSLRKHLKHCKRPKLKCLKCNISFATKDMYQEHANEVHAEEIRKKLKMKGATEITVEKVKPKLIIDDLDLTKVTLSEDKKSGTCNLCGKSFKELKSLRRHIRHVHEGLYEAMCSICGANFKRSSVMKVHMIKVHGEDSGTLSLPGKKCRVCDKPFVTEIGLQRHLQISGHSDETIFPTEAKPVVRCTYPTCKKTFKKWDYLREHIRLVHENREQKVVCDICGKYFRRVSLKDHIKRYHEGGLKFSCDICGKGSQTERLLLHHKAAIHSIGDIKCPVDGCPKVFSREDKLEEHKKYTHEGFKREKPHVCSYCGRGFDKLHKMRDHENAIHTQDRVDKPFQCQLCGSTFAVQRYLDYHVKYTHMKMGRKSKIKTEKQF